MVGKKNLVFISHATPEDNTFAIWLSTRLKLIGYTVWSDVTKLFGGEKWWQDIEEAIDSYSCKFIIVITRTSLTKPGVQREIQLALAAQEKNKIPNYIIPIIIDDSSFSNQPYGFSELNIVSFKNNWAQGLSKIISRMERDSVPKQHDKISPLAPFITLQENSKISIEDVEQTTISNWLPIQHIPEVINFYRLPVEISGFRYLCNGFPRPWFEYSNLFATFSDEETVKGYFESWPEKIYKVSELAISNVLENKLSDRLNLSSNDASNKISYLIKEAWERSMRHKGLKCYEMANGKSAWFFPFQTPFIGKIKFAGIKGETKNRAIMGRSEANDIYWHFCISVMPSLWPIPKLSLLPHVVFTEDGIKPIENKTRMHTLRRRFCKMWWNPRWRDMLLTYLSLLSSENGEIDIPVGSEQSLKFPVLPLTFQSPISLILNEPITEIDEVEDVLVPDDEIEELDD